MNGRGWLALPVLTVLCVGSASAQTFSQRGFLEARGMFFPQEASSDPQRTVVDVLAREEAFARPAPWVQLGLGVDLRANSHDQVERSWRPDFADRGTLRPAVSVRRLSATFTRGGVTIDLGRQFIRWGKTDIVTPTDCFAPRDFLNVIDNDFLAVSGARTEFQWGSETLDAVWVPFFTPSRIPLLNQRWTRAPSGADAMSLVDAGKSIPHGSQFGVRWSHSAPGYEYSVVFFDGFNHLPNIHAALTASGLEIFKTYPSTRTYGGDAAVPTRWFTVKAEAAYFTSPDASTDEYVLYVVQLERQTGEWLLIGGYAGEAMTADRALMTFAPDRGLARAIVGRASYAIDTNRSVALEGAARQNGRGAYAKGEYSQARGQHWRATVAGAMLRGEPDDFFGQYRRNSYLTLTVRYSF